MRASGFFEAANQLFSFTDVAVLPYIFIRAGEGLMD
jgi:hypothetical protein